ncbi:unnamed protein product [Amoebophrya sp. A120]|nr:unnamed protein product [Amoebophrya sp. A120]|eukprot:GSA120T00002682001.1
MMYRAPPSDGVTGKKKGLLSQAVSRARLFLKAPLVFTGVLLYSALAFIPFLGRWIVNRVVSNLLPKVMGQTDKLTRSIRAELLKTISGKVLDFGAGSGIYMKYCFPPYTKTATEVTKYVALEPNRRLHSHIQKTFDDIRENKAVLVGDADGRTAPDAAVDNKQWNDHVDISNKANDVLEIAGEFLSDLKVRLHAQPTFDWIILGNVLCEVPDPPSILRDLDSLLKPGGFVFFSEHVGYRPANSWRRWRQNLVAPWWRRVSDGCQCNRDTMHTISRAVPNWAVHSFEFDSCGVMPWNALFQIGLAKKIA